MLFQMKSKNYFITRACGRTMQCRQVLQYKLIFTNKLAFFKGQKTPLPQGYKKIQGRVRWILAVDVIASKVYMK